jgi:hypothetical protein
MLTHGCLLRRMVLRLPVDLQAIDAGTIKLARPTLCRTLRDRLLLVRGGGGHDRR